MNFKLNFKTEGRPNRMGRFQVLHQSPRMGSELTAQGVAIRCRHFSASQMLIFDGVGLQIRHNQTLVEQEGVEQDCSSTNGRLPEARNPILLQFVKILLNEYAAVLVGKVFVEPYQPIDGVHGNARRLLEWLAIEQMGNDDG